MSNIQDTLDERGSRYGDFKNHAKISQDIQKAMMVGYMMRGDGRSIEELEPYMLEALAMIAHKIGRILNGDPYYADSWVDIVGYAQLVVNELEELEKKNAAQELQKD